LQAILEQERKKAQVTEQRRQGDAVRRIEETALVQGARFATRLLEQASGPDTQARLVELLTTGLGKLPAERIEALQNSHGKPLEAIVVVSAFALADDQRQRLQDTLSAIAGADTPVRFEEDSALLAGVRITIGPWVLGANLQDELKGFTELAYDG
jgi:F-type H+-transporting ATPase subunit b